MHLESQMKADANKPFVLVIEIILLVRSPSILSLFECLVDTSILTTLGALPVNGLFLPILGGV